VETIAREVFRRYHYHEIRTPILEETQLFARGVGEETDIVTKEMYTFDDRDGSSLTLRPENTASVIRAYIEHRLNVAGGGGKELFTADAHAMIFQHTGGSPRLVNVLCDAALHAACLRASGQVSAAEILVATQDARWPDALAREKARPGIDSHVELPAAAEEEETTHAVAQLLVSHRKEHIATWPLSAGRISIGRASDNEMRLEAPFISRHHCQILTVGAVSTVEDLGSVNGIAVNGKLVKRHVLQHADQIVVGEHVLTYVVT